MPTRTYATYHVLADSETGQWLDTPEPTGARVDALEWDRKDDTTDEHYDTYEVDGVTRAIVVEWVD